MMGIVTEQIVLLLETSQLMGKLRYHCAAYVTLCSLRYHCASYVNTVQLTFRALNQRTSS